MAGVPDPSGIVAQAAPVAASQNIVVQGRSGPAFQANAFFNPAFQTTSYSQQAFQQCAFSHTAFQTDECISNGRSGYWRLFFTQMQEEALKKPEEKKVETFTQDESKVVVKKVTERKPKKVVQRAAERPQQASAPILPFKRKPVYTNPTPVVEEFPVWVSLVSVEIDQWMNGLIPLWNKQREFIIRTRQAANDADYRLRLLLLAA